MKKLFAIVLSLCMLFTAFGAVAAAEEETISEINWSDYESQVEEAGWEGNFVSFADVIAIQIWVPTAMEAAEVTDEEAEGGILGYYQTEDGSRLLTVMYVDAEGMSLEEYAAQVEEEYGATDIDYAVVNGILMLSYKTEDTDMGFVTMTTEAGYILEFGFSPMSDEDFVGVMAAMIASIQAVEE